MRSSPAVFSTWSHSPTTSQRWPRPNSADLSRKCRESLERKSSFRPVWAPTIHHNTALRVSIVTFFIPMYLAGVRRDDTVRDVGSPCPVRQCPKCLSAFCGRRLALVAQFVLETGAFPSIFSNSP